jgi:hypothetical protein
MKLTLNFDKRANAETYASITPSDKHSDLVILYQTQFGVVQDRNCVQLTYKEANQLREWLNINLPR